MRYKIEFLQDIVMGDEIVIPKDRGPFYMEQTKDFSVKTPSGTHHFRADQLAEQGLLTIEEVQ